MLTLNDKDNIGQDQWHFGYYVKVSCRVSYSYLLGVLSFVLLLSCIQMQVIMTTIRRVVLSGPRVVRAFLSFIFLPVFILLLVFMYLAIHIMTF